MAYVVTEPCIDVKDGDCTDVCPVDCIYEGGRIFYIHPEECVNCGLCLSVCPVDAIIWDEEATPAQSAFIAINREFFNTSVSGIGSPGGWDKRLSTTTDHPAVAQYKKSAPSHS